MTLSIWLSIALAFSVGVNLLLLLFSVQKSRQVVAFSENITELIDLVGNYRDHLKVVYELEAFYGDPTLESLLQHTIEISKILEEDFSEFEDYIAEYILEEEQQNGETQTEEPIREKDVLYAGARERNN
tara:strand:- start:8290 stop:8676 length:387 start_codon:yes stop_codon:yes gene_type:complete